VSSLHVQKTLRQQASEPKGVVAVDSEIIFDIVLTNNGQTPLIQIPLQDQFNLNYLTYVRASPVPSLVGTSSLSWNNLVGSQPLQPGAQLTVTVRFLTKASTENEPGRQTANIALSSGARDVHNRIVPTVQDTEALRIANSAITIYKRLQLSQGRVAIGDEVTFIIEVENAGNVPLTEIPIYDIYEADVLQYLRSNIREPVVTVNSTRGELWWSNVVQDLGVVMPGSRVQFETTFRVLSSHATTNTAHAENVRDENGDPVPPAAAGDLAFVVVQPQNNVNLYLPQIDNLAPEPTATATATPTPTQTAMATMTPTPTTTSSATPTPLPTIVSDLNCPADGCIVPGLIHPKHIAVLPSQHALFITSRDSQQLFKLDTRTNEVLAVVATGAEPWGIAINEQTNHIYVSNFGGNDVWIYDATSLTLLQKVEVGPNPVFVEILPHLNTVAVVTRGNNGVALLHNMALSQILGSTGVGAFGLAAIPTHDAFVVINRDAGNGRILYKDELHTWRNNGPELKFGSPGERTVPFGAVYNPNTRKLYVQYTVSSGRWYVDIFQLPPTGFHPFVKAGTVEVGSSGSNRDPNVGGVGLAVHPGTNHIFVANNADGTLSILDGFSNQVIATVAIGIDPFAIAIEPNANRLFVLLRNINRYQKWSDEANVQGAGLDSLRHFLPLVQR
jgi:YVTN family beta-propeller protein